MPLDSSACLLAHKDPKSVYSERFLPSNITFGRKSDLGPTLPAAGGALVLSGGAIWVGSCAVGCVLSVGGSMPRFWTTQGLWGSKLGARRRFISAALAHFRSLVIRVLVLAGQPMACSVPQVVGYSVAFICTV